jgi:predicted CoA-binding protein
MTIRQNDKYVNPSNEEIDDILTDCKVIAVVGLSSNPSRPSYVVADYLKKKGYRIIPVNPTEKEILGEKCYSSLKDVPDSVDIVDIFRQPQFVMPIVEQAIEKKAKAIWMQEGIVNNEAALKAREHNLKVIMDKCILKEVRRRLIQRELPTC